MTLMVKSSETTEKEKRYKLRLSFYTRMVTYVSVSGMVHMQLKKTWFVLQLVANYKTFLSP